MKTTLTGLGALLLLLAARTAAEEPKIFAPKHDNDVYASYRQLVWDDFKGSLQVWGPELAMLASTIQLEDLRAQTERTEDGWEARVASLEVVALMDKLQSSSKSAGRNDYTLRHEQGHFDITELGARRLRRAVLDVVGKGSSEGAARYDLEQRLREVYAETLQSMQKMQMQYDGETSNGQRKGKQKLWWKKLQKLMDETDGW
ncbi:MAG: DUF922 domain-containing protein [Acidobacteriota bacterium]